MRDTTVKNYIMAIYEAGGEWEIARTSDVAKALGYSLPSVTEAFQKLSDQGYIEYIPHRGVKITKKGKEVAKRIISRWRTIRGLLKYLGVPQELAEIECKKLELVISEDVIIYINDFLIKHEGRG